MLFFQENFSIDSGYIMQKYYEEKRFVTTYEADFTNKIKLNTFFNYMQDAASSHAENMGLGFSDLRNNNLAWILRWAKIKIEKYPGYGNEIKIKTWPKQQFKLFSIRDFIMTEPDGNIICRATTAWLLINTNTKKICELKSLPKEITYLDKDSGLDDLPGKFSFPGEKVFSYSRKLNYSDIDLNNHTNNSKYIEFASDCFDSGFYKTNSVRSISASFLSESFEKDILDFSIFPCPGDNRTFIEAANSLSGKPVFQADIEYSGNKSF